MTQSSTVYILSSPCTMAFLAEFGALTDELVTIITSTSPAVRPLSMMSLFTPISNPSLVSSK